jgi:hypothetical protein
MKDYHGQKPPRYMQWGYHAIWLSALVLLTAAFGLASLKQAQVDGSKQRALKAEWVERTDTVVQVNVGAYWVSALTSKGVVVEGPLDSYFVGSPATIYCNGSACASSRPEEPLGRFGFYLLTAAAALVTLIFYWRFVFYMHPFRVLKKRFAKKRPALA